MSYPYCRGCGRRRSRIRDIGGGWAYRWQGVAAWSPMGQQSMVESERHDYCPFCRQSPRILALTAPPVLPQE